MKMTREEDYEALVKNATGNAQLYLSDKVWVALGSTMIEAFEGSEAKSAEEVDAEWEEHKECEAEELHVRRAFLLRRELKKIYEEAINRYAAEQAAESDDDDQYDEEDF